MLARDEVRDQVHRPWAVERDQRDDILEAIGPRAADKVAHAARFQLEHCGGVPGGEQLIGRGIVEGHTGERKVGMPHGAHGALGQIEDRERGEAEEVELDESDRLDVVLVELRDHMLRAFGRIERAVFDQPPRRDEHAAGVHADVAHQAFELLAELEQLRDLVLVLLPLGKQRLGLARIGQRDVLAGLHGNQLRDLVAEVVAEIEHPADVAYHGARCQGAERGDLRHALRAELAAHIVDHAVAAVLAEVDVEVRHRDALGIQETLEEQVVAQWIEVGDAERISDERSGTRAAARPDRHAVLLRPVDEIGHDQEVAGEAHLHDGADLEIEPRAVPLECLSLERKLRGAPAEARLRFILEVIFQRHARGRREVGQPVLAERDLEVAAARDLDRVVERVRRIGEELGHLLLRLEVLLRREKLGPALVAKQIALCDADARLVRLEVVTLEELHRMRRHDRQLQPRGERDRA